MGADYSYECTKAKVKEIAHTFEDGTCLAICNLKFIDENGHPLEKVKNALVYIGEDVVLWIGTKTKKQKPNQDPS